MFIYVIWMYAGNAEKVQMTNFVLKCDEKSINKCYLLTGPPARSSSRVRKLERGDSTGAMGTGKTLNHSHHLISYLIL